MSNTIDCLLSAIEDWKKAEASYNQARIKSPSYASPERRDAQEALDKAAMRVTRGDHDENVYRVINQLADEIKRLRDENERLQARIDAALAIEGEIETAYDIGANEMRGAFRDALMGNEE